MSSCSSPPVETRCLPTEAPQEGRLGDGGAGSPGGCFPAGLGGSDGESLSEQRPSAQGSAPQGGASLPCPSGPRAGLPLPSSLWFPYLGCRRNPRVGRAGAPPPSRGRKTCPPHALLPCPPSTQLLGARGAHVCFASCSSPPEPPRTVLLRAPRGGASFLLRHEGINQKGK